MAARKNEWVYDQLLGFLGSPLFQLPVITYMEARCIIFEPGTEDSQEYREVHKEYKHLVETLLEGFMKDTELTYEQILKALQDLRVQEDLKDIFQVIFEQVLSMEDFGIFVRLMTQKNIELQQQALLLIIHRIGSVPEIMQPGGGAEVNKTSTPVTEEDAVLRAVLEQSKREYEEMKKTSDKEKEQLDAVLITSREEASYLEEKRAKEQEKMNVAISQLSIEADAGSQKSKSNRGKVPPNLSKPPFAAMPVPSGRSISISAEPSRAQPKVTPSFTHSTEAPPVPARPPTVSSSEAAANWLKSALSDANSSGNAVNKAAAAMGNLTPEQVKERQEYLRQQRDKLLEMKKREREKQLQNAAKDLRQRPTSARVAHKAISRGGDVSSEATPTSVDNEKKLAMRKAIAERLKAEVIGSK
ncbi:cilia- and flagella-associated protein 36-like [Liolophura sinensis]|uniref:cilia- and flagella-associated protein 36-like n=1 Tax=Liolophura sinensis TaxID=3198878 RepID=UPI0031587BD3